MPLPLLFACTSAGMGDPAMVLLDADALDAGWAVEVDGEALATALPLSFWYEDEVRLVTPDDATELQPLYGGELLFVEGAGGHLDWLVLGEDVDPGVARVLGDEDAAWDLADQGGAEVVELDGGWELQGVRLLEELSHAEEPRGLEGLQPSWGLTEVVEQDEQASYNERLADLEDRVGMLKTRVFRQQVRLRGLEDTDPLGTEDFYAATEGAELGGADAAWAVGVWRSGDRCVLLDASGFWQRCDGGRDEGTWDTRGQLYLLGAEVGWQRVVDELYGPIPDCSHDCSSRTWRRP